MYLTSRQRLELADAVAKGADALDTTIRHLQIVNAKAFHTPSTLPTRVFFDQPVHDEPCLAYVRPCQTKGH